MQKLLSAVLFVLSAIVLGLCVQFVYENGENGCTAANEAPLGTEILERKISSLLHLSDDNVNKSFKWPYEASSSVNESRVLSGQNFVSYSPAESNIKNQTAAATPESSDDGKYDEQEYITAVSSKLLHFSRPFDASTSPSASAECRQHTKLFLNSLNNLELWAVKMYDSSSRLPSGILNGNINQFGDFDQCLSVQGPLDNLQGQYCLAYVQPTVSKNTPHLRSLFNLVESHGAFRSAFNDPGHRVPRFSLINWALCVPSSCTAQDVEYSVREYLEDLTNGTGISVQVRVEPKMCHVKKSLVLDNSILLVGAFFLTVIAISIISTLYDLTTEPSYQSNWLVAFSLRKNFRWLFSTRPLTDDISAAHGIRFLNAFMLLISHKTLAIFFNPYVNRTYMTESLGHPWTVFGRAASIYTDPFLLLSGMLTSYSMFGKLNRGQSVQLKREYFGRLLRILPPLGAIILFCTYILPIMGSGPQWNLVVTHHSDLCKRNWWRNILFIHNYFGFSEMCLTHTHHLGIDTELFALAPIMILGLWKWPRKGLIVLISLATLGTAARFYTTIVNRLSNYIYYGTTIQRLFKTADYMYSFPPHRSTVYILGILLGYALQKYRGYQLTSKQLKYGWIIALICFFCTIIGPAPMSDINYKYNPIHAAFYAALSPLGWCAYFSWIIFTSHLGYKSKCSEFFSWRGFQITTKLSYSIYLTQFPVFFFNVGRRRFVNYFSFLPVVVDIQEFICIAIASICLTLLFDAPFQNIKSILFKKNTLKNKLSQITDKCKTVNCNDNYVKNTKD